MKKMICGLLILTAFLVNAENLLKNGDFENVENGKPAMWTYSPRKDNFVQIDMQDAVKGRNSAKIVIPSGKAVPFLFNQKPVMKIPANTPIKLSGWFKSENYHPVKGKKFKRGIYTCVSFADGSRAYPTLIFRPTKGKWQYKEQFFTYPKEIIAANYVYLMHYNASGTVKYDNLYFGPWTKESKLHEAKPFVLIPKIGAVPRLDGKLDDICWKKAAEISNFVLPNKDKFAKNRTEAYMAYDERNLYVATRSFSSILDPTLQMLDKFSAKETARDGSVFSDDSIEIFISRPDGNYFQFAYNALGTQYDGQKLEKSWNCNWTVKAAIHDGFWEAEAVIPFEALEIKPKAGGQLGLNVCRNDCAEKESASWSKCETGFHDVDSFGFGIFGQKTLQMAAEGLPLGLINLGRHELRFKVSNLNFNAVKARINIELTNGKSSSLVAESCFLKPGGNAETVTAFELKSPGKGKYRYILTDCSSGMELLRSPVYGFTTKVILQARNQISFPGKLELLNNGKKIGGKLFFLEKGKNDLVVKCTGTGSISGGIALLSSPDSLPETISFAGNCKGTMELKKTVWIEDTKLFPFNIKDGIYLEPQATQHIPLQVIEPSGKTLEILVPAEIELVDFKNGESGDKKRLAVKTASGKERSIDGVQYKIYRYSYICPSSLKKTSQIIYLNTPKASSQKVLNVYFRTRNDRSIEAWQKLRIFPMNFVHSGKRPKKLKIELWHTFIGGASDKQTEKLIETFALTGFNEYVERLLCYGRDKFLKPLRDNKMKINAEFHTEHQFHKLLRKYPEARGRNFDGKTSSRMQLKPPFICGKGREEVKKIVKDFVLKYHPDSLIIDMEKSSVLDCDASPESLTAFAEFAGLSKVPGKEEILKKYRVEWGSFMCLNWSKIAEVIKEGIKSADPEVQFAIYSSYQSARNKMKYSIDWSLMRGVIDFAEMGYGRQPEAVRDETLKALGNTPSATGVLFYQKTPQKTGLMVKNKILRRITDGAKGITFYNWSRLDGVARTKISEACAILADYESFFLKNKQLNSFSVAGNIRMQDVVLLADGKDLLLLVFNDRDKVKKGRISLKNSSGMKAFRWDDGKTIAADKLELSVKPFDTAVLKISKK